MSRRSERGFTLLELVVVIVVLVILLAASTLLLRPKSYANTDNDSSRRLGLAVLAQSLREYKARFGAWPEGIPVEETSLSNRNGYDICKPLVPVFLRDLPLDPELGVQYTGDENAPELTTETCDKTGVNYVTGYTIHRSADGVIALRAISSNLKKIEVSIR